MLGVLVNLNVRTEPLGLALGGAGALLRGKRAEDLPCTREGFAWRVVRSEPEANFAQRDAEDVSGGFRRWAQLFHADLSHANSRAVV